MVEDYRSQILKDLEANNKRTVHLMQLEEFKQERANERRNAKPMDNKKKLVKPKGKNQE